MKAHVLSGLDGISRFDDLLQGKRVGLMTNPTGIDHQLRSSIDILNERYRLSALFGCEHGVRGDAQAGDRVDTYTDAQTGVTVYSVYGKSDRMTREMLDTFDVLVFDIQDVGARFYTYLYSLSYAMEECAKAGKTVLVLDRINPIGTLSITAPEGYTALDAVSMEMQWLPRQELNVINGVWECARVFPFQTRDGRAVPDTREFVLY